MTPGQRLVAEHGQCTRRFFLRKSGRNAIQRVTVEVEA